jgi:uncharacterized protein
VKPKFILPFIALFVLSANAGRAAATFSTPNVAAEATASADGPLAEAQEAFKKGLNAKGVELLKPLAAQGNSQALFMLGVASESGQGVEASIPAALDYYKKAAAAGYEPATYRHALLLLNSKDEKERQQGRSDLETAAKDHPAKAGRMLGEAWMRGLLSEKPDFDKAAQWWKTSGDAGDTESLQLLGRLYEGTFGFPEKKDPKQALAYYRKAADLSDKSAYSALGSRLLNGDESIRNVKEGLEWLNKAADEKVADAFLALGDYYENNKKDDKAALEQYQKGSDLKQADCTIRLAAMYANGRGGVEKNEIKARDLLKDAAEGGSTTASLELAARIAKDEKPDYQLIYKHVLSAANSGLPIAQNELGLFYLSGNLGLIDPIAAFGWFTKAARAGYPNAQVNLASLYARGVNGSPDYGSAGQLYTLAFNKGSAEAATGLATLYFKGLGIEKDAAKAWAFASVGVERGDSNAKDVLANITSALTPEETAKGKEALEKLKKTGSIDDKESSAKPADSKPAEAKPAAETGKKKNK